MSGTQIACAEVREGNPSWAVVGVALLACCGAATSLAGEPAPGSELSCEPGSMCYAYQESIGNLADKGIELSRQTEASQRAGLRFGSEATRLAGELQVMRQQIENGEVNQEALKQTARRVQSIADMLDGIPHAYRSSWDPLRNQVRELSERLRDSSALPLSAQAMTAMTSDLRQASDAMLQLSVAELANLGTRKPERPPSDPFSAVTGLSAPHLEYGRPWGDYYGKDVSYSYAIVTVPDPRIPRNGRSFDLVVEAINQAMADSGYQFDRYLFPWGENATTDIGLPSEKTIGIRLACSRVKPSANKWIVDAEEAQRGRASRNKGRAGASAQDEALREHVMKWMSAKYCTGETLTAYKVQLAFPWLANSWSDYWALKEPAPKKSENNTAVAAPLKTVLSEWVSWNASKPIKVPIADDGYGILAYRKDEWRCDADDECGKCSRCRTNGTRVALLFVVAERMTSGVDGRAMLDAWLAIEEARAFSLIDSTPSCSSLEIVGPAYSGSLGSMTRPIQLIAQGAHANSRTASVSVVSPTATAGSNDQWARSQFPAMTDGCASDDCPRYVVSYTQIGAGDLEKEQLIEGLLPPYKKEVMLLVEDSIWGASVAEGFKGPGRVRFPPNVRELSIGAKAVAHVGGVPDFLSAFRFGGELRLDADIGSEFVPKYAQQTTARTLERQLMGTMERLKRDWKPGSPIVIAATDVRDQLFMARRVRAVLPGARLIFLEADNLLAHPDYVDATRGAWVISSANLTFPEKDDRNGGHSTEADAKAPRIFPKDDAILYYRAVRGLLGKKNEFLQDQSAVRYFASRKGLVEAECKKCGAFGEYLSYWSKLLVSLILAIALFFFHRERLLSAWGTSSRQWPKDVGQFIAAQPGPQDRRFLLRVVYGAAFALFAGPLLISAAPSYAAPPPVSGINAFAAAALVGMAWLIFAIQEASSLFVRSRMRAWLVPAMQDVGRESPRIRHVARIASSGLFALCVIVLVHAYCDFAQGIDALHNFVSALCIAASTWLALTCIAMAYETLQRVRGHRAALMAGVRMEELSKDWVGHAELPIFGTPLAAWPDDKTLSDLPFTPGLSLLRRIRQFCGSELALLRVHLLLAMSAPILPIGVIYMTPVPAQNFFLIVNLVLMVFAALLTQAAVLRLEKDEVLSAAFCRTGDGIQFGVKLAGYLVLPVIVIALGSYLALQPGVRESTDTWSFPLLDFFVRR